MNILTVDNITKSYGVRKIFDGASFFLQEGEKAGIIGINGTGKSDVYKRQFKYIGVPVEDLNFNQPKGMLYPTENPFA